MVGLRLGDDVESVTVDCEGNEELIPYLPAATWDKLLSDLSRSKDEQLSLLQRWEEMLKLASASLNDAGQVMLAGMPLVDRDPHPPDVTLAIEFVGPFANERLGVTTKFKPFHRADATIAETALWSVWDWTVQVVPDLDHYAMMLENMLNQSNYYRDVGLPRLRDVGKAPFYGAMKSMSDHMAEELGARVGLTGQEYRALSDSERDRLMDEQGDARD